MDSLKPEEKTASFKTGDVVRIVTTAFDKKMSSAPFEGVVIAQRGEGPNKTFTVRKISSDNVAVEKIFPINSPSISKITVLKHNRVRRAKLYYLRNRRHLEV